MAVKKFQSALFQNGMRFELATLAIENASNLGLAILKKAETQRRGRCHSRWQFQFSMRHRLNARGFSWREMSNSRGGRALSRIRIDPTCERLKTQEAEPEDQQKKGNLTLGDGQGIGPPRATPGIRGRIPIDDFHKSASEGEGACSRTSAGRSHLPLRGKLGWMTPRPGQKKAGKRNAS
jgi:hypothetical protein